MGYSSIVVTTTLLFNPIWNSYKGNFRNSSDNIKGFDHCVKIYLLIIVDVAYKVIFLQHKEILHLEIFSSAQLSSVQLLSLSNSATQ